MTEVARLLLDGIDEDAVDFRPNYDGQSEEPVVLPAAFPNLLANGSQGIAVGMATSIPPHNAAELCDAALHLIDNPNATHADAAEIRAGSGFPDRRHRSSIRATRSPKPMRPAAARSACARAGRRRTPAAAPIMIVITEIPWLVQKSRLVEKHRRTAQREEAAAASPTCATNSAEDVRLVIEPRARTVDPELLMELLFKLTELESRIPLNMNVLIKGRVPKVDRPRRSAARMARPSPRRAGAPLATTASKQIEHRLEVLGGYLIAYLNLDKVIKIIRNEDEPKPVLIKAFKLTDVQAEAILNMRLRNLRKLEEMEIRKEDKELRAEKKDARGAAQVRDEAVEDGRRADQGGARRSSARRRRSASAAPSSPRRPSTTRPRSRRRWSSASRSRSWCPRRAGSARCAGTSTDLSSVAFKADDKLKLSFFAETTSKLLVFAHQRPLLHARGVEAAGRARPRRAGAAVHRPRAGSRHRHGVPVTRAGASSWSRAIEGSGFVVAEDECLANTRKGKQVLNVKAPDEARAVALVEGEQVASIGENRKMVVFPLEQVPEMARGRGVRLQRYKDGGLSDVKTFKGADGLTWTDGAGRAFSLTLKELADWRGNRADAGRLAPKGFPRSNKFR